MLSHFMSSTYAAPAGCPQYFGPVPQFFLNEESGHGTIEIARTAPSWVVMNAYDTAEQFGWEIVDPDERFETTFDITITYLIRGRVPA